MEKSGIFAIVLAFLAFISLGLPDGLLGVAWPGIRRHFALPVDALGTFLFFSVAGYMTSSFLSGALVRRFGVGRLLAASCAATGAALGVYSIAPAWWVFVLFALLGGLGAGAIDAGLNGYVDRHYSHKAMQWLHASFGVGITLGPLIMTTGIALTGRWQPGYRAVAAAQLALAAAFWLTRRHWTADNPQAEQAAATDTAGEHAGEARLVESILHGPSLVSMLLFFVYTGAELGLGLWAYTLLTESRGVDPALAGIIAGSYWASFTIGRVLAGLYTTRIPVRRLVGASILSAIAGSVLIVVNAGEAVTLAGIVLTGFSVAPVFPGMLSDTRNRVERRHLANTIGMQIAAAGLGAAALPALAGVIADALGLEAIPRYLCAVLVLLMVLFLLSHRKNRKADATAGR